MKWICLAIACACSLVAGGQNLVPNPSFEDSNTCFKYQEKCSPKAWRSTTLKGFRYNEFLGDRHKVKPVDGNRYISLVMHNVARRNDRKFVQAPLLCPLVAGVRYEFSLYFKTQYKAVQQFGVYFPKQLNLSKNNDALLKVQPQIVFQGDPTMPVNAWQKLSGSFVATGEEQGIILGNFFDDEHCTSTVLKKLTRKQLKERPPLSITYYSFDQLHLVALDSLTQDCDLDEHQRFLYLDTTRHIIANKPLIVADMPVPIMALPKEPAVDTPLVNTPKPVVPPVYLPVAKAFVLPDILFENNSAVLLDVAYPSLHQLLEQLQTDARSYRLKIVGHTDNVGQSEDNLILSQQRAQSVAQFLIASGIAAHRLEVDGKGETVPIADNTTEAGRFQNRRVSFYLIQ